MTGLKIAEEIALPFSGVADQLLTSLKQEKFIEVKSSQQGGGLVVMAHTLMELQAPASCALVKPWIAANMPGLRLSHLMFITMPSAVRRVDA